MRRASIVLLFLCSTLIPSPSNAQIQPLTEATYKEAIEVGKNGKLITNSPLLIGMRSSGGRRNSAQIVQMARGGGPFFFYIDSPFTYVSGMVRLATQKFQDTPPPSMEAANARLVILVVNPGRQITTADAIENAVILRGEQVIRPSKSVVQPTTVQNALGATRELSTGEFSFPFETFAPGQPFKIVLVGKRGNFEWEMTDDDLRQLR